MLTLESVLALAPDDASAKAARGLTGAAKWPTLGADAAALWGECQGSGSKPYQTQVDLAGPAFRCSCPSRKFPCKHGLALMLLRVDQPAAFSANAQPAWVSEWLAARASSAQKKEERQAAKASEPVDLEAQALARQKSETQRWHRIEGAAQDLQRWLLDQFNQGLGALGDEAQPQWQTMAARMVDAQAPGLGQRVREAAEGLRQGADWPERTLQRLGLLQLACEGIARRIELTMEVQADLRVVAGWPQERAEVLAQAQPIDDRWTVLGVATEEREGKLLERRVWLHGQQSGRRAWLLDHAFGGRGFEQAWLAGSSVQTALAFFPGASALRALAVAPPQALLPALWPQDDLATEWDRISQRVAACPWVNLHPLLLRQAVVLKQGEDWLAVAQGRALPLQLAESDAWTLLACGGGQALQLAGEWDGRKLRPLSAWRDDSAALLWQTGSTLT